MKFSELDGLTKEQKDVLLNMFAVRYNLKVKESVSLTVLSKEYRPCYNRQGKGCYCTALFRFKYKLSDGFFYVDLCDACLEKDLKEMINLYADVFSSVRKNLEDKYSRKIKEDLGKVSSIKEELAVGFESRNVDSIGVQVDGREVRLPIFRDASDEPDRTGTLDVATLYGGNLTVTNTEENNTNDEATISAEAMERYFRIRRTTDDEWEE